MNGDTWDTSIPKNSALSDLALEYLTWLNVERGRASTSLGAYKRDLASYEAWMKACKLDDHSLIEISHLEQYIEDRKSAGFSNSTISRSISAIRGLYKFGYIENALSFNPAADLTGLKVKKTLPIALSEEQVTKLLDTPPGDDPRSLRDKAMLEVLYGSGLRISELIGISLADLDLEGAFLKVTGKGSKERIVPLGSASLRAIYLWLSPVGRPNYIPKVWKRKSDQEALFLSKRGSRISRQGAWETLGFWAKKAGLGEIWHPHLLRHSCATHMLSHGADIRVVQELLGHSSITTTQIYTSVTIEHLRRAYLGAHPRASSH
ncbi:MAG: tyrosine recombinase XerD [Acidimicrobiales bacterium]|nr:tyrosine recombinase XerD [Acidimicrobiales bacterium]